MSEPASAGSHAGEFAGAPIRIAMWSGPRNLSTALMRSFGNRPDCAVADEPFYAAYLAISGVNHPMRNEVLRHQENDWRKVAAQLAAEPPSGERVFYQKHMTHHMLPEIGRDWMRACRHGFLIRHPARVLASYAAKRETVELRDIGFEQQAELFDRAADLLGEPPPVVDADELLGNPRRSLQELCRRFRIPFSMRMLSWPAGGRESDGIWAAHWYDSVNRSTGFERAKPVPEITDHGLKMVEAAALPFYGKLARYALG